MVCSFRMIPNAIKSGESCSLIYEGSTEPANVTGKKIHIKIMEIDKNGKNDLLAEFESALGKGGSFNHGKFVQESTNRIDSENHVLPSSQTINDSAGNPLPVPLEFKPAYFSFKLWGIQTPFIILMKGDKGEIEDGIFEIGISILMDSAEIFNSFKMPVFVDCTNLLGENCLNAALFFKRNHDSLLNSRGVGTHFGDHFPYFLQQMGTEDFRNDNSFNQNDFDEFKQDRTLYGLQKSSCIGYVKDSMDLGFSKTGMTDDWKKIWKFVKDGRGDLLAKALVKSGWLAYYYNPDVIHPNDDAAEGTAEHKEATEHTYSYANAVKNKKYYDVPVSGYIINYYPTKLSSSVGFRQVKSYFRLPKTETSKLDVPSKILKSKFGFVVARGGMHTAMYSEGKIFELHWNIGPRSYAVSLFEISDFQNKWPWNSGLLVFPPGCLT